MADYQTTEERWDCKCGASGYDIVPSHDCPLKNCDECQSEYNSSEEGDSEHCQTCKEYFESDEYKLENQ